MDGHDTASRAIIISGNVPDGTSDDYQYDCFCVCTGLGRMGSVFGEFYLPFTIVRDWGNMNEN